MNDIQKFQDLLKNLFQFEMSDLDFGIYRILNFKREKIKNFIEKELQNKVEYAFAKYRNETLININERFEEVKQKVIQELGQQAFTPAGELKEEFKNTPLGKTFISVLEQKEEAQNIDEVKNFVFNDLYNFFSRYYEQGDFIPQYRYSIKGHKYTIPYNGEEVKLYWANNGQYYIKTGLLFRDYTFNIAGYKVTFRVTEAKEELGSNKATKERFFILDDEKPLEIDNKTIVIRFQFRELTDDEIKFYDVEGGSNTAKQEKINQKSYEEILRGIDKTEINTLLSEKKNDKSYLLYHLNRFAAKNTKDYFIHKDLRKFLTEQLDYFIKSEVLDIQTLSLEKYLDKHITRAKVVKEIGDTIIGFLSQIEDFQKKLWEKKKFVLSTEYVITIDKIKEYAGESFLKIIITEILKNENQIKEWQELGFGEIKNEKDLILKQDLTGIEYKKLPIDTKYFSQEFKESLLENLTQNNDLDDILDGLLIKSENWQALNLLLNKYKEKIQTIYIDPPFNKEQNADYLYNVKYKDSTWISILENRLRLARNLMSDKGSIFVRCDYNGNWLVRPLMNEIFGEENFRNEIVINRTKKIFTGVKGYNVAQDSLFFYSKSENFYFIPQYKKRSKEQKWLNMHSPGERRPPERVIFGKLMYPPKGRHWTFIQETIDELIAKERIRINEYVEYIDLIGNRVKGMPQYLMAVEELLDSNYTDIPGYSQTQNFPTENSEILLKRVIESTSNEGDLVMDFFLGSGTTTAVAHKLKRKWIGVEMGEHFWAVILPRMKKVLYYDKSQISKEKDVKEKYNEKLAGGFFKYQILEQYEDTLDNIELNENQKALELFKDEYLIKYFLDYETRESPYLLNIEKLQNPFAYKLKVNIEEVGEPQDIVIDIPETFNYLLGLKVKKIKTHEIDTYLTNSDIKRKYLFILGDKEGKDIAIIWREYENSWNEDDFKKDKEFITKELKLWRPTVVYINGQSILTPKLGEYQAEIRYIELEFKKLMER